jgi:hypothetical protein
MVGQLDNVRVTSGWILAHDLPNLGSLIQPSQVLFRVFKVDVVQLQICNFEGYSQLGKEDPDAVSGRG